MDKVVGKRVARRSRNGSEEKEFDFRREPE